MLNFNIATKPLLLIVIGLGYAAVYYLLFRFVIRQWNLRTPGREDDDDDAATPEVRRRCHARHLRHAGRRHP